jgi:probable DNA repair protein
LITTSIIDLFHDLEQGARAITSTRSLAHQVEQRYARWKLAQGATAWPTPSVLSYDDWLSRLWRSAFEHDPAAPRLLIDDQELLLWERVIGRAARAERFLFQLSSTARVARRTWERIHDWHLEWRHLEQHRSADTEAFLGWAAAYRDQLEDRRWLTAAQLSEYLVDHHHAWSEERQRPLWWMGFDIWPTARERMWGLLQAHGVRQTRLDNAGGGNAAATVVECSDPGDQWTRIARWARSELEKDTDRALGVVCPDLSSRREEIEEILEDVLHPGLAWRPDAPRAHHISLGHPLSDYPIVRTALDLLRWGDLRIPFEVLSRTLRSPYLNGGRDPEPWTGLELSLRKQRQETFSLAYLHTLTTGPDGLDGLRRRIESARGTQWPERADPSAWASLFSGWLQTLGWPGGRPLDSNEFQTVSAWHETLSRFSALNAVQNRWTRFEALKKISSMASARILQFHDHQAPLQVMGASESPGIWFDEVWLADMSDAVWPSGAQPDPFIPVPIQKERGMPGASAQSALEHARLRTGNWLASAAQVHISFVSRDADAPRSLSPLFTGLPAAESKSRSVYAGRARQLLQAGPPLEQVPEHRAPVVKAQSLHGGTGLVADQAKCPFRALAHHRLHARDLRDVTAGLDASERGTLVHKALSGLWDRLGSLEALGTMDGAAVRDLISDCVADALQRVFADSPFKRRFLEIEGDRLESLLAEWLELEKQRAGFKVVGTEIKTSLTLGGIEFTVRVDRVDELSNGRRLIIDYKTGRTGTAVAWADPRPEEPQLPLYALSSDQELAALVVASVNRGGCVMRGLGDEDAGIQSLQSVGKLGFENMAQLRTWWASTLGRLVDEHKRGEAWVEPKHPRVCRLCDAMPLCRIFERSPAAGDGP